MDNLAILSTDNIRRLFFVLLSLNFYSDQLPVGHMTQGRRRNQGERFLLRLSHYLISAVNREIIWGVVGLLQYVKVLLSSGGDSNNPKILDTLQRVDEVTQKHGGKIRAEFYIQLSELLKPQQLAESPALVRFLI